MSTTHKIDVFCPKCKAKLAVPVSALGKSGKCPHCQSVFPLAVPANAAAPPPMMTAPLLTPYKSRTDFSSASTPTANSPLMRHDPPGHLPESVHDVSGPASPIKSLITADYLASAQADYEEQSQHNMTYSRALGLEKHGIDIQVIVGPVMMIAAALLLGLGLLLGSLRFVALSPIMFVAGCIFLVRGIMSSIAMKR